MDSTVVLRLPRSAPEVKMLLKMCNSFLVVWIPVLGFFCREDNNKEVGALLILISLQTHPERNGSDLSQKADQKSETASCAVAGLVLLWSRLALNVQPHGNRSHVPTWSYVRALVCSPHSAEGASGGPSWNCLARALQRFWLEWGCATCFSRGKNEGNRSSTTGL